VEERAFIDWLPPFSPSQAASATPTFTAVRAWGKGVGLLRNTGESGSTQLWRFRKGEWRAISPASEKIGSGLYGYGAPAWTPFGSHRALCLVPSRGVIQLYDDAGQALRSFPVEGRQQGFPTRWSKHEFAYVADFGPEDGRAIIVVDVECGLSRTVWRTADFIGGLSVDVPTGRVAWHGWPSGTMPWDTAQIWTADRAYMYLRGEVLAGTPDHAAMNPTWLHGDLYFQLEEDERFRPARFHSGVVEPVATIGGESLSDWFFGWPWTVALGEGTAHVTIASSTTSVYLRKKSGTVQLIESAPLAIQEVAGGEKSLWVTGSDQTVGSSLWRYRIKSNEWQRVSPPDPNALSVDEVSLSELRCTDSGVPFVYYEPTSTSFVAPLDDRPGLIVDIHGGPTAYAKRGLRTTTQFFTKLGFAFASVDYRGSVGYGASYRRSLNGHYGEYDVDDIRAVARFLIEKGEVDSTRVFVRGGSSGGLTALLAGEEEMFVGVIAHYPVTDAHRLNAATHEVEGRYLEELIGSLPDRASQFEAVSPQYRDAHPRRVLITHGAQDAVIPIQLVRDYVAKLEHSGVDVTFLEFAAEGHGYRSPDVQAQVLSAEQAFLRG